MDALDIQRKHFSKAMLGYSIAEVDAFLADIAAELVRRRNARLAFRPPPPRLGVEDLQRKELSRALRGYAKHEVDKFLSEAAQELSQLDDSGRTAQPMPGELLSALDVQHKVFSTALRGYAMHEVDTFLDQVAEELATWAGRLRGDDVRCKRFRAALRGYAMREVEVLLDHVIEELDRRERRE